MECQRIYIRIYSLMKVVCSAFRLPCGLQRSQLYHATCCCWGFRNNRFLRVGVAYPTPSQFLIQRFPSTRLVANQCQRTKSVLLLIPSLVKWRREGIIPQLYQYHNSIVTSTMIITSRTVFLNSRLVSNLLLIR